MEWQKDEVRDTGWDDELVLLRECWRAMLSQALHGSIEIRNLYVFN